MSVLTFDKSELSNLEYALQREMLATDRRGGYMSTTIVCCNTRKYHGLMVAPIDDSDRSYVLLSSLDETVVQHDQSFNLALHRFKGVYEPRGHNKYITDFEYTPTPTITYRVGGVILRKELLWIHKRTQLMIRYTLLDAHSETTLRLRPFFAFRDKHALSHANMEADGRSWPVPGGVRCRLYRTFPWLYLQIDKDGAEFVPAPDWWYGFEYPEELRRGYEGYEDLLTTGYFETTIRKGESIVFSASVAPMDSPGAIREAFDASIARRTHKIDFLSCMHHSARQFVIRRSGDRTEVIAGYPWFGEIGRQTLVALPGITLEQGHKEDCMDALDTIVRGMRDGMFTGTFSMQEAADAPLWFFWTLQRLAEEVSEETVWRRYGEAMKQVLGAYRRGVEGIGLQADGLIRTAMPGRALTWMDTMVDGAPVAPRSGYAVEINALWYNAVCYALRLAERFGDEAFAAEWRELPERTRRSFLDKFWIEDERYLADYVDEQGANRFIRPNMIVACGLDFTMLDEQHRADVVRTVRQHLLTPKGLRSLSPRNPLYESRVEGGPRAREIESMNGAVWVWPLWFYVKAAFDLGGRSFLVDAEEILAGFDEDIQTYGIGSVNELYDADPPFTPRGAISQAWSVGAVLGIHRLIERYGSLAENRAPLTDTQAADLAADMKAVADELLPHAAVGGNRSDLPGKPTGAGVETKNGAGKRVGTPKKAESAAGQEPCACVRAAAKRPAARHAEARRRVKTIKKQ